MKPLAYLYILLYCLLNFSTPAIGAPADKIPDLSFEALEAMDFDALMNIKI
jgi:hypothetical protein